MTPAIELQHVSMAYGQVQALQDVCLTLPAGAVHGLIGINGAGKSTLFGVLTGSIRPDAGTVRVPGPVAYVPQSEKVDWTFPVSVRDVVTAGRHGHMGPLRRLRAADRRAVDDALARTDLTDLAGRQIGQLSGGQRKRAFVARGLAQDAATVLLDEPFAGVDRPSQRTVSDLLRTLADDGRCVLIATHDLASVPGMCDTATLLQRTVVAHGAPSDVLDRMVH